MEPKIAQLGSNRYDLWVPWQVLGILHADKGHVHFAEKVKGLLLRYFVVVKLDGQRQTGEYAAESLEE